MAKLIISVHIPKTGGSSFKTLLMETSKNRVFVDNEDRPLAGDYSERRLRNFPDDFERCKQVYELMQKNGDSRIFIHGHFVATKYGHIFPQAKKIVWFRDPVERLASHYYYWQREPDMKNDLCVRMVQDNLSLEEFACLVPMKNIYKRFLTDLSIERFDFVGITEEYEKSISLFSKIFGVKVENSVSHVLRNPEKNGAAYNIDFEMRKRIAAINQDDYEIYIIARDYFNFLCVKYNVM